MTESDERIFLHALNNKIAVIDGRMSLLLRKMKNATGLPPEDVLSRIEQIQSTVNELNQLAVERRAVLQSRDAA